MDVAEAGTHTQSIIDEVGAAVISDRAFLETIMTSVVAGGHVLLEDVPGTGKTLTANSFANALGLEFSRIQFTPDLLPADITGSNIYNDAESTFEFVPGPIFANVVLADEINRAPPKTQSALLEAMEEGQVTVDGEEHDLPDPFFVIATQNPVEQEGTFPLPEAQVDRFWFKDSIGYPDRSGEKDLIDRRADRQSSTPTVDPVVTTEEITRIQRLPESVTVDDDLRWFITDLARETRSHPAVDTGVSPRGTQRLFEVSRARAVLDGRDFVTPADVTTVAPAALAHRLVLTAQARMDDRDKRAIVRELVERLDVPNVDGAE
ncbi:MoxR family ATPase [Haloarcula sp. JP-L23]|uniref:AAA family ATPase n=1 Tax=Haloarcula sp. JP-L23 TaxID=2716717 RepID=UPI00140EFE02|nr:MoxR family ATPase [Haloarcula sp. JP-L23]